MLQRAIQTLLCLSLFAPAVASADQYILYLHGRLESSWTRPKANLAEWTNVTFSYDGNAYLEDAAVNSMLKSSFQQYCGIENSCIVICYSAGCMRTLKTLDDLRAEGIETSVMWIEASASAAGGTAIAESSTAFGGRPIDWDLRRDNARGKWAHIQDATVPAVMYHIAGNQDTCYWYGCGNWLLPVGMCDGAVCVDSSGGASKNGSYFDGCDLVNDPGLYPGRMWDTQNAPCEGLAKNHAGMGNYVGGAVTSTGAQR